MIVQYLFNLLLRYPFDDPFILMHYGLLLHLDTIMASVLSTLIFQPTGNGSQRRNTLRVLGWTHCHT